jgi:ribosomal-protein-alanine N-acetyltransferase
MTGVVAPLAGSSDLDGVVAIEDASFNNPTPRSWYEAELARPDVCHVYVLRLPEMPVAGFAAFWRIADEMHINNLAVHPAWRRRGLGRQLLAAVLERAREMGIRHATLEVRQSNAAAIGLYTRQGFRTVGLRRGYYSRPEEDALVLALEIEKGLPHFGHSET